ncbi:prolyl oligopeptidase family serine peptidase [Solicola sp. PLA-1-18]|uniref:S9 family peptidase n=1 Tax=Solicola sp. PLA-1-18 TaxID=3380532 RepID=UPI003B775AFC
MTTDAEQTTAEQADSYPRLRARTQRFTLGIPRQAGISADGTRVAFLRTESGTSSTGALWQLDVETGEERLVADPAVLLGTDGEQLSPEERARRERSREAGAGIVGWSTDAQSRVAAFALSGQVWVAPLDGEGQARALPTVGAVIDPRVDPTGTNVAYASEGALRVIGVDGDLERPLVTPDSDTVVWGQAEFVAAEEMNRFRGFWWAPDGDSLLVERYDEAPVGVWHVADPADPAAAPVPHRYPAAGTADAEVSLWVIGLDGSRVQVAWDWMGFPYLTRVSWTRHGAPVVQVMSRDQRTALVLSVDVASGETTVLREQHDDVWVDLVGGVPTLAAGGRLLTAEPHDDVRRVHVDGEPVGPADLHVRDVLGADDDGVLVSGSVEPTEVHLVRIAWDGTSTRLSEGTAVHGGSSSGGTTVVSRSPLDSTRTRTLVLRGGAQVAEISSRQAEAGDAPRVEMVHAGEHALRTAVLFPRDHARGSTRLPVLMDPYGGPHAQRVLASGRMFLEPQWLADQGFCVVVSDGRGTPARGRAWERTIRDDFAGVTLQDQVDALAAVAERFPDDVDTSRVGIAGWSYGGYLSALAVLRRPDVFHAAVAGAPVTDWRLYDTFYTERYLGHPDEQPDVYDRNSLLTDAADRDGVHRPLMIVHGMVDDNVVVAHALRLSSALLAAGRPHSVLPLTGVTHMASDETVAENLSLLQVDFLRRALQEPRGA